jgi:glycosyltransferase involved in cell wall biosynthesis
MNAIVFETCDTLTGHRLPYASATTDAIQNVASVTVALNPAIKSAGLLSEFFPDSSIIRYFANPRPSGTFRTQYFYLAQLARMCKEYAPDHVAIPTADGFTALSFFSSALLGYKFGRRSPRIDICLMQGTAVRQETSITKYLLDCVKLYATFQGPWNRILLIDPLAYLPLRHEHKFQLCPDPVPQHPGIDKAMARKNLGLPEDSRLILSIGNQDHRKGTDLALRAFLGAEIGKHDYLVLFGKFSKNMRELVDRMTAGHPKQGQVIIRDRYVDEVDFQNALVAASLIVCPYRSAYRPSGIICRAIAWGIPLLTTDRGWPNWAVRTFSGGSTSDCHDTSIFADAISHSLDHLSEHKLSPEARAFRNFNSLANYKSTWQAGITGKESLSSDYLASHEEFICTISK